jgi:hypothetical protein
MLIAATVAACNKDSNDMRRLPNGSIVDFNDISIPGVAEPLRIDSIAKAYSDCSQANYYWITTNNGIRYQIVDYDVNPACCERFTWTGPAKWKAYTAVPPLEYIEIDAEGNPVFPTVIVGLDSLSKN